MLQNPYASGDDVMLLKCQETPPNCAGTPVPFRSAAMCPMSHTSPQLPIGPVLATMLLPVPIDPPMSQ